MPKENGKDVANSLSEYSNTINKGTNIALDSVNQINKWYEKQVEKIIEGNTQDTRLETNVDNNIVEETEEKINKLQTKVEGYTEIQTNNKKSNVTNQNISRLKTQKEDETLEDTIKNEEEVKELGNKKGKIKYYKYITIMLKKYYIHKNYWQLQKKSRYLVQMNTKEVI